MPDFGAVTFLVVVVDVVWFFSLKLCQAVALCVTVVAVAWLALQGEYEQ